MKPLVELTTGFDPIASVNQVMSAQDVGSACAMLEQQLHLLDHDLLSVKFCDLRDERPAVRPFGAYPSNMSEMAVELQGNGGCPISKEALIRLSPFDAMSIDRSSYSDFLSNRFLQELKKMSHAHIAVIPIVCGRGLAVFTIGLREKRFEGQLRELLITVICNATAALIGRFPEISKLFKTKQLSSMEARAVLLCTNGHSDFEIGNVLRLGEFSVNIILNSAAKKLGASNRSQLAAKALAMG